MTRPVFAAAVPAPNKASDAYNMAPMPNAEPLDLPPDVRAVVDHYFETNEGHDYLTTMSVLKDPVEYDFSDIYEV